MRKIVREPELEQIIGVCGRTIRDWRYRRIIPYLKVKRVVLYDVDKVLAALDKFERV